MVMMLRNSFTNCADTQLPTIRLEQRILNYDNTDTNENDLLEKAVGHVDDPRGGEVQ